MRIRKHNAYNTGFRTLYALSHVSYIYYLFNVLSVVQKTFTESRGTGLYSKFKLTGLFQILSFFFFGCSWYKTFKITLFTYLLIRFKCEMFVYLLKKWINKTFRFYLYLYFSWSFPHMTRILMSKVCKESWFSLPYFIKI